MVSVDFRTRQYGIYADSVSPQLQPKWNIGYTSKHNSIRIEPLVGRFVYDTTILHTHSGLFQTLSFWESACFSKPQPNSAHTSLVKALPGYSVLKQYKTICDNLNLFQASGSMSLSEPRLSRLRNQMNSTNDRTALDRYGELRRKILQGLIDRIIALFDERI
jgi:hypothetical protein